MFTSHAARHSSLWIRVGLSILAGACLIVQIQCGGGSDGGTSSGPTTTGDPTAIARENALPGTSAWQIANPETNGEIAAYPDHESYPSGAEVRVSVSANPAGNFRWQVFRMGGYRGMGGRLYAEGGPVAAPSQAVPTPDRVTGLVVAGWTPTFSFSTRHPDGTPWLTGVYLIMLTKQDGWQTSALFILRDDTRDAEVGVKLPTATYQAYNNWGGESLYESASGLPGGKALKVSLDRPIARQYGNGTGTFLYQEYEAVKWLEDHGYDVEYAASTDIAAQNGRIGAHRLFMIIGHEEYATMAEFDRLLGAIENGTSLAFLTGNTLYWQIRYENNDRVIVCYKDRASEDPMRLINQSLVSTSFRNSPVNRPENQLVGVMSDGSHILAPQDWVVTNANHWVYANTGLANGSHITGLIFTEWDGLVNNGLTPPGIVVLADSEIINSFTPGSRHEATIYERGNTFVFAAGSIFFSQHIRTEPAVGQMVANLLSHARATAYQP
jgi:N,N-dimethylformamidase beta subunit-like protein